MAAPAKADDELAALIAGHGLRAVYQPIVRLEDHAVVAIEALARGPQGSALESPAALFARARAAGLISELDWACRRAALEGARGSRRGGTLFLNVEPSSVGRQPPPGLDELMAEVAHDRGLVLELTERAITSRPGEVLAAARRAHRAGWGVAVDDVGADPRSLALLPFLDPDIIKLDLRLIQDRPNRDIAATMTAVLAAAERSGAQVLAEGIETPAHLATARGLGATLGQGWLFGRPGALAALGPSRPLPLEAHAVARLASTPYEVIAAHRAVRRTTKGMLIEISKHLEEQARSLVPPGVLLAAFQEATNFTEDTQRRYATLGRRASLVAAFGAGMPSDPAPGVRGGSIADNDPLLDEWSVTVVGPHYAAALAARDTRLGGVGSARQFDYAVTHDRSLVLAAAETLLVRITPEPELRSAPH